MEERRKFFENLNAGAFMNDQRRLVDDLLDMQYYEKHVHPRINHLKPTRINVSMSLYQILDVDEHSQSLVVNVWMVQNWFDEFLDWDPREYGMLNKTIVPYDQIWIPDTYLYNSWTHDKATIDYWATYPTVNLKNMARNDEWEVLGFEFERIEQTFKCCVNPWVLLYAHLVIRRKPLYYVINLVSRDQHSSHDVDYDADGWYYLGIIIVIVLGTLMATIVLAIHGQKRHNRPLSRWARGLVLNRFVDSFILKPPCALVDLWSEFGIIEERRLSMSKLDPLLLQQLDPVSASACEREGTAVVHTQEVTSCTKCQATQNEQKVQVNCPIRLLIC
ncbi:Neurotransmitter-gated ion-channel ligand binding domain protein [Teladorsagia circumcincta]|uniref:Neurotransmitter-gated ion-channel ligand binding domain protein n=1 Tax=Teladorsagia circumcincta TaxID=45464 RepID=A0A2G9URX6_TELCI|nr:Neurotransmitter-gated ion-channel ligand binding domain protein [Teladorsagia circumcincta]